MTLAVCLRSSLLLLLTLTVSVLCGGAVGPHPAAADGAQSAAAAHPTAGAAHPAVSAHSASATDAAAQPAAAHPDGAAHIGGVMSRRQLLSLQPGNAAGGPIGSIIGMPSSLLALRLIDDEPGVKETAPYNDKQRFNYPRELQAWTPSLNRLSAGPLPREPPPELMKLREMLDSMQQAQLTNPEDGSLDRFSLSNHGGAGVQPVMPSREQSQAVLKGFQQMNLSPELLEWIGNFKKISENSGSKSEQIPLKRIPYQGRDWDQETPSRGYPAMPVGDELPLYHVGYQLPPYRDPLRQSWYPVGYRKPVYQDEGQVPHHEVEGPVSSYQSRDGESRYPATGMGISNPFLFAGDSTTNMGTKSTSAPQSELLPTHDSYEDDYYSHDEYEIAANRHNHQQQQHHQQHVLKHQVVENPHAAKFSDFWDYGFVPSDDVYQRDPVKLGGAQRHW